MDGCQGVEREITKVSEKFQGLRDGIVGNLDDAIQRVQACKNEIQFGKLGKMKMSRKSMIGTFLH